MALRKAKITSGLVCGLPSGVPTVTVFKGIPFAKPPVGDLRWRAPQPCDPWEGEYKAYAFGPVPPSHRDKDRFTLREFAGYGLEDPMEEDCLYLDVWTPAASPREKLPVLVWIHGGGFVEDFAHDVVTDGDAFASRHGVILVAVEYRTGMLGFLSHPLLTAEGGEKASGNYGMLDQVMALTWVRDNIGTFGGDPDNVTICGESAGGMSVLRHLCSPLSKGLFHRAIVMSGTGYNANMTDSLSWQKPLEEMEEEGIEAFRRLGISSLDEARALPWEKFISIKKAMPSAFHPGIDGYFTPKETDQVFAEGTYNRVPILMGCCSEEAGLFKAQQAEVREIPEEEYRNTCRMFQQPALDLARLLTSQEGHPPIYFYWFSRSIPGRGPWHALDMNYMFRTLHRMHRKIYQEDLDLTDAMNSYWAHFAQKGDPNGTPTSHASHTGDEEEWELSQLPLWKAFSSQAPFALELGDRIGMMEGDLPIK